MRKLLALVLALSLLCGCTASPSASDENLLLTPIYYISSETLLSPLDASISAVSEEATIRSLYTALQSKPRDPYFPAISSDVLLEDYSLHGRVITLFLSEQYESYSGIKRTLSDAALTLSFCALSSVDRVVIRTPGFETAAFSASDFVFAVPDPVAVRQTVTLYFTDGTELKPETRTLVLEEGISLANEMISALLAGPKAEGLSSAIPSDTKLHSVVIEDGVCTVDLSERFLALPMHTEDAERLCLFSLVNTLAGVSGVEHVRILINGSAAKGFSHYDLTQALQPEVFN